MKTPQDRRTFPLFPKLLAALLLMGTAVSAQIETYVVDVVAKQPVVIDGHLTRRLLARAGIDQRIPALPACS
ncbi:MAG: hypothetical protein ACOX6W_17495 [Lentisphaeria bacterium]